MDCLANPYTLLLLFFTSLATAQYAPPLLDHIGPDGRLAEGQNESSQYQTLMKALKATDLAELLDNGGNFTVFAPSDKAFQRWSAEKLSGLMLPENREELRAMLSYHIIAGKLTAASILRALCRGMGSATFITVQGNEILASMEGIDIVLTDCSGNTARITTADSERPHGVVHVIDRVILPR